MITDLKVGDKVQLLDDKKVKNTKEYDVQQYYKNSELNLTGVHVVDRIQLTDGKIIIGLSGDFRMLDLKRFKKVI